MSQDEQRGNPILHLSGLILGAVYRGRLFPKKCRQRVAIPDPVCGSVRDEVLRELHVVKYLSHEQQARVVVDKKLFVYVHGRARSASASFRRTRDGKPGTVETLLKFGTVFGVNLPGYGESVLTDGNVRNAEVDTMRAAMVLAAFVREQAHSRGIKVKDVIIVGFSIGMYLSIRTAIELGEASIILLSPPSDLESVMCSVGGYSLAWLPKFAARYAYPPGKKVSLDDGRSQNTVGYSGVKLLSMYGSSINGRLAIFRADEDDIIPRNAGILLQEAFEASAEKSPGSATLRTMEGTGHDAVPTHKELESLFQQWGIGPVSDEKV